MLFRTSGNAFADNFAQLRKMLIDNAVENLQTGFSPTDQSGSDEDHEMPGYVGLTETGQRNQSPDTLLSGLQGLDNLQTIDLSERPKPGRHCFKPITGELFKCMLRHKKILRLLRERRSMSIFIYTYMIELRKTTEVQ